LVSANDGYSRRSRTDERQDSVKRLRIGASDDNPLTSDRVEIV